MHIFIPLNFFICSDFPSSDLKIIGIKTYLFEISAKKKVPENSRWPAEWKSFKMGNYTIF